MSYLIELVNYIRSHFSILSFFFYICLAFFLLLYYTIGKKFKIQWILLLGASLFFYFANGVKVSLLIFAPIMVTYAASLCVVLLKGKMKSILVFVTLSLNTLFLIYFKEQNFFVSVHNVFAVFLHKEHWNSVNILAPLGVSYIILMLISYILDVSWESIKPQKNPLRFMLYAIYFPVTTSGPITRYSQVENQLFETHSFNYDKFCFGVQRIVWGLFKKLVIAERIGLIVNTIYGNWENYQGFSLAIGLLLYAVLVYFDFSGCVDIILGISECLGISLPENFRQPLFATSLSEIWRRWHMTLGFWVKDYVLYPVLKSQTMQNLSVYFKTKFGKKNRYAKLIPTWLGMFVTWFVVGFWHGGSLKFIFGGGLFFFIMIAGGQLLEPIFSWFVKILKINTNTTDWQFFQRIRTFFLFAAAVSFQRADSFITGLRMWKRAFKDFNPWIFVDGTLFKIGLDAKEFFILICAILIVILVSTKENNKGGETVHVRELLAKQNLVFRWLVYFGLVFSVIIFGMYGPGYNPNFVYAKF